MEPMTMTEMVFVRLHKPGMGYDCPESWIRADRISEIHPNLNGTQDLIGSRVVMDNGRDITVTEKPDDILELLQMVMRRANSSYFNSDSGVEADETG